MPSYEIEIPDEPWVQENKHGLRFTMGYEGQALAELLLEEVVFIGGSDDQKLAIYVNCNDVFAWGLADGELLESKDIEEVWKIWKKDGWPGLNFWCCKKRNQLPQAPVLRDLEKAGFSFDGLGLMDNYQNAEVQALVASIVNPSEK